MGVRRPIGRGWHWPIALLLAAAAAAPVGATPVGEPRLAVSPILLYWTSSPELLTTATHVTPQVWVAGDAWAERAYPAYPLSFWQQRGVVALRSLRGVSRTSDRPETYIEDWVATARRGYPAIAIDEFSGAKRQFGPAMAAALRTTRAELPEVFIAVWHAGLLNRELAECYRDAADLVILEAYARDGGSFALGAGARLAQARNFGIVGKCILALGVNDTRPGFGGTNQWASRGRDVRAQLEWVKSKAPDTAGVAFFAIYASPSLMSEVETCVRELFGTGHGAGGGAEP